jgi:hypothetical protein
LADAIAAGIDVIAFYRRLLASRVADRGDTRRFIVATTDRIGHPIVTLELRV